METAQLGLKPAFLELLTSTTAAQVLAPGANSPWTPRPLEAHELWLMKSPHLPPSGEIGNLLSNWVVRFIELWLVGVWGRGYLEELLGSRP